jgi:endonuclease/exonuclease/phosphatase (EEP) superfamily protein YafD
MALLARLGWPFELFAHFRPQYAAFAAAAALACLFSRHVVLAAVAAILAALNAMLVLLAAPSAGPVVACSDGPLLTVATANAWFRNEDTQPLLDWLRSSGADIVVVQEVTPRWAEALAGLSEFPHRELHPRPDPYGIAILSRHPLSSVALRDLAGDGLPSLDVTLEVHGHELRLLGLHTHWPILPRLQRMRDLGLEQAAGLVRDSNVPAIVAGDLNLTPWAPVFGDFLERSGLRDPFGRSLQPTWIPRVWPSALRIDHVLVPPGMCTVKAGVGPDVGSDPRPVLVSVRATGSISRPAASRP